jgi:hypothetical protein
MRVAKAATLSIGKNHFKWYGFDSHLVHEIDITDSGEEN